MCLFISHVCHVLFLFILVDTCFFISKKELPSNKRATYGRIVVSVRPEKVEKHRTRLTVGGNLIDYPGVVSTDTANLTTTKFLFNSVISTKDAKFSSVDISNFYLGTPMPHPEYMWLPFK